MGETCRLRYTNPDEEDEVIAVLNPLEESDVPVLNELSVVRHFKEFTRLKISGDKELVDTFPVLKEDFGGDVPEIFVDWYSFEEEQWFSVARVYPVDGGGIDQVGVYKNTSLYGFEKFVGEQRTDVTGEDAVTTDIVDALQAVLDNSDSPESYVVEAPTDAELSDSSEVDFDERPEVEEFSFQGDCQKAFRDLRKYGWVIMFTAEKDGGDVVVRFEPVGWGGIEASLNAEEDPLYFDYWKKKDLSTIVSDVEVIGVDADGEEVKVRKIKDAPRDKYKRFNIGWIQSESEAESVAENQLQLEPVEHGKLETFIFPQNTLNYSIDVFDSEKGVDGVFTVAHQKDLFHSGQTEFSFEFERELTDQERDILRTQDERNNELNTRDTESVLIDLEDDLEPVNSSADADNTTIEDVSDQDCSFNQYRDTFFIDDLPVDLMTGAEVPGEDNDFAVFMINLTVYQGDREVNKYSYFDDEIGEEVDFYQKEPDSPTTELVVNVYNDTQNYSVGEGILLVYTANGSATLLFIDPNVEAGDNVYLEFSEGFFVWDDAAVSVDYSIDAVDVHDHDVFVFDGGHGGSGDDSEHVISGETAEKLFEIFRSIKEDR